jgi:hypothetical protein
MSGQEYVRQWVSASNDYLVWIWNTLVDNWLLFWNSDLFKELTKPHVLKLFGLSAALGILLPIIIMLGWRFLTRRNSQKSTYEKVEDDAIGSFNAKVINSIKSKPKKKSKKDFDKIPKNPKNEHVGKKPTTSFDNSESSPLLEDDALTADDEQSVTEKDESRIKKTEHMNSTRIMPDFTLKDGDIEELSHMKFHVPALPPCRTSGEELALAALTAEVFGKQNLFDASLRERSQLGSTRERPALGGQYAPGN